MQIYPTKYNTSSSCQYLSIMKAHWNIVGNFDEHILQCGISKTPCMDCEFTLCNLDGSENIRYPDLLLWQLKLLGSRYVIDLVCIWRQSPNQVFHLFFFVCRCRHGKDIRSTIPSLELQWKFFQYILFLGTLSDLKAFYHQMKVGEEMIWTINVIVDIMCLQSLK